jgi:hypothetical protein
MGWIMMNDIFLNQLNNMMNYQIPVLSKNHITYLRHAGLWAFSFFYRYVVPTGQTPSVVSLNPLNPRFHAWIFPHHPKKTD